MRREHLAEVSDLERYALRAAGAMQHGQWALAEDHLMDLEDELARRQEFVDDAREAERRRVAVEGSKDQEAS